MNRPKSQPETNMKATASTVPADQPLSLTVLVILADSRQSTRVVEVGRDQTFGASPAALASLPGQLHRLMHDAEADAVRGMNQFLAQLVQSEPPATSVATPAAEQAIRLVPSAKGLRLELVTEPEDAPVTDDYLLPVNLPLTGLPPVLSASAPECPVGGE
ncbi:MAG: hypothetical protein EB034_05275 [Verrucomicrobia bacterium]|nr:hypothetical protein [Verrucomicrobiota bacterium]